MSSKLIQIIIMQLQELSYRIDVIEDAIKEKLPNHCREVEDSDSIFSDDNFEHVSYKRNASVSHGEESGYSSSSYSILSFNAADATSPSTPNSNLNDPQVVSENESTPSVVEVQRISRKRRRIVDSDVSSMDE